MKLERQVILYFQKGSSDKVYEIDLCEVGTDQYTVNFRYGRRGADLRDGSKTPLPVDRDKALALFDKLVADKKKKGYAEAGGSDAIPEPEPVVIDQDRLAELAPPDRVLLQQLVTASRHPRRVQRGLGRLLWRVGERRLDGAREVIAESLGAKKNEVLYAAIWAAGRCGLDDLIPRLETVADQKRRPDWLTGMACEVIRMLQPREERDRQAAAFEADLPPTHREALANLDQVSGWFQKSFPGPDYRSASLLRELYIWDLAAYRPALLRLLRELPVGPPYMPHFRNIFKVSLLRDDFEVFGLLAYRFEAAKAMHSSYGYVTLGWDYFQVKKEARKTRSRVGFTSTTREYLYRRCWRELKKQARDNPADFVRMATEYLGHFTDEDVRPARVYAYYDYATEQDVVTTSSPYAGHFCFSHLLFANSPRFEVSSKGRWRCRAGVDPAEPRPEGREEAYPEIWDAHPQALIDLLRKSASEEVHHFACKVLQPQRTFSAVVPEPDLVALLGTPYEITQNLALAWIEDRLVPDPFPMVLLSSLLAASAPRAHDLACGFISEHHSVALDKPDLLALLATHPETPPRRLLNELLVAQVISLTRQEELGRVFLEAVLALDGDVSAAVLEDLHTSLSVSLAAYLRSLDLNWIKRLLDHPAAPVQWFAGKLLLQHEIPAGDLPGEILAALLRADDPTVRATGISLVGNLPVETLLERDDLILESVLSPHAAIRQAAAPIIERVALAHGGFARLMAATLSRYLQMPEEGEAQHADLAHVLCGPLDRGLAELDEATLWRLVKSRYRHAREVAAQVLTRHWDSTRLSVRDMVTLAHNDTLALREYGRAAFARHRDRVLDEMDEAVRLPDTDWEDCREFAFRFFREELPPEAFAPAHLVALCDSTRPAVRAFGRDLLTRHFQAGDGRAFLVRLSEHPSADMQLLATNLLLEHAQDSAEELDRLEPFLTTVLLRVNRSRIAKTRVFAFLARQAEGDKARAERVRDIIAPISQTIAVGDRDQCMSILLSIRTRFPQLDSPLEVHAPPIRERRPRGV
ncbi:WGR domain-containing protein [Sulfidibacter corallicola]|uniref:WGR domain-containing protein n=1 Tax=Sulfidibacter corallicola TaxID=2818388 RepID=A0A8A4TL42_SULCO|nr:WGR domain-containing protein [Sulfidibacter corallicola]QTD50260.1 WGR domain-containing protein [Sulfidibacter corallicola]